jgi:hypothetical protein
MGYFLNPQMKVSKQIQQQNNLEIKNFIVEAVLANSDVRMEVDEGDSRSGTAHYVAMG